ncbi:maleylpyruvate isomerase N-terminal domain-containing protein [Stackebrandtia nassauensis]|uniref:Mycothiol-dependent maleylpyruvate isomerase metal-binding domain-containing protein n=1 Tax=Stackebrandtia nassauensis (strain DSM 44728 / CIP 108903 / NRRL B-16338 / NBRC 102104 / LLR-40K-21) TaxID=446470 RepID=D3PYR0_STANL|nr:maleylpyruvate isomerase N-terminal domain-containing protein [Stackebrandtia nassauensis]ADD43493.1 hypothetical protein Snas_3837 [Stackebrandtia nassauensis DSM 44728]
MTGIRTQFLSAARIAEDLLRQREVVESWKEPSALAEFSVGGLAGHLAYQVLAVRQALTEPEPTQETVPLLGHYDRVEWIEGGLDADINVRIRGGGEELGAPGPQALVTQLDAAITDLAAGLPALPNLPVHIPLWRDWSLLLDDFLTTRILELTVHCDDLAVSVGIDTPDIPDDVYDTVLSLLARLSAKRHGPVAVLRALSRSERSPGDIAAM